MNGRKAKALRRQAEEQTIGLSKVNHIYENGKDGTIVLGNCTRAVYKGLKKQAKQKGASC